MTFTNVLCAAKRIQTLAATPVPFFGIGAMRAGTTWLSQLLRSHPDCAMTAFKEIHFFDIRYGQFDSYKHYRSKARRLEKLSEIVAKRVESALEGFDAASSSGESGAEHELSPEGRPVARTNEFRAKFSKLANIDDGLREISDILDYLLLLDNESYVRYMTRYSVGVRAFGEISPNYGLLPAAAFAEIDSLFPAARYIFIMRDPVDRLWSHVRFKAGNAKRRDGRQRNLNKTFRRLLASPYAIEKSSYQSTIDRLESVIPADRILYLFYERMVSPKMGPGEVRRIESALGLNPVDIDPDIFTTTVNASTVAGLDRENEVAATKLFVPVYKFVQERFGTQPHWRIPEEL
jgi:hypothetical protein